MSPTDKQKLRVQHKKTDFTRTVKGTSLSGKDQTTSRNIKITKGKISLVKQTYAEDSGSTTYEDRRGLKRHK